MLRPRGLRLALSIFRLYFQQCRSRAAAAAAAAGAGVFSERQRLPQNIVSFSFPLYPSIVPSAWPSPSIHLH